MIVVFVTKCPDHRITMMMDNVVGKEPIRDFVSSSLLFLKKIFRPNTPARPRTLYDEDYEKLHSDCANYTAIVAHSACTALIDQSHDTNRMTSTITKFHEMMHNNDLEVINNHQSSLLRGCSVSIDEITPTSNILPTSDSLTSFTLNRYSCVSIKNNGSVIRTNHKANLNLVLVDY